MPTLSPIRVPVRVDTSQFTAGLAASAAAALTWGSVVGTAMRVAFPASAAKLGANLRKALDVGAEASHFAKTGLAVADLTRYAAGARNGLTRLGAAVTLNADKSAQLRAKADQTSASLRRWRETTERLRFGVFAADLGMFVARVGLLGERILPGLTGALSSAAGGMIRLVGGTARAVEGVVGLGNNLRQTVTHLNRARDSSKGAAVRAVELWSSWYYARQAAEPIKLVAGGMFSVGAGALRGAYGVGRLAVSLASTAIKTAVGTVKALWGAFTGLLGVLGPIVGAVGLAAAGVAALVVKSAAHAAHLNETFNKVKQTFGDYAGAVLKDSDLMSRAFGTNQREFLDGSSAVGAMLQGMGYGVRDPARIGSNLAKLAADVSAYRDIPFLDALTKIRAGLSGESEPLKAFGILVDENAVKSYAYANGLAKVGSELTLTAKAQARMAIITAGLGKDLGALGREATGPAAQIAQFWGRLDALMNTVGQTFAPVLGELLQGLNVGLAALQTGWERNSAAVLNWFGVSAEGMSKAGVGVATVQAIVGKLGEVWSWVTSQVYGAMSAVVRFAGETARTLSHIYEQIGIAKEAVAGAGSGDKWFNSAFDLRQQAKALTQWSSGLTAKGAGWQDVGKKIADNVTTALATSAEGIKKASDEAVGRLSFAAEDPLNTVGAIPKAAKKAKSGDVLGGAFEFATKEAYSVEARHFFGTKVDVPAKETARNTRDMVAEMRALNAKLGAANGPLILGGIV